ncbi:HAD family phosphatase [Candidatus Dojkabacteria bacterium]|nr:HAD family phosphatase [Candidatus Dojkabacteria bacterium]
MNLNELLKNKKGYIFDVDGTIVDLEELNFQATKYALESAGLPFSRELYIAQAGVAIHKAFENILNNYNVGLQISELLKVFRVYKTSKLRTDLKGYVKLKPGVADFIKKASESGKKLAVATSARREFLEFVLTAFELLKYFPITITADDITKSKPDPEIFLKAQTALALPKADCIVFEDSKNGILGAKAAGIACIGIKTDRWNKDIVNLADYVINDYTTILTIFPGR